MRANQVRVLAVILLLAGCAWWLRGGYKPPPAKVSVQAPLPIPTGARDSYSTNFRTAENPISEQGRWISGKRVGIDWSDVATVPGLAYGTESGTGKGNKAFDDSTALLAGAWAPDQTVEATVHSIDADEDLFEEVELRLRSSLSARSATGYEVLFRCSKTKGAYASIVRWDGPLGKFVYLAQKEGTQYGVADGDTVKATMVDDIITGYINGIAVIQARDSTFRSGSPGMGFWLKKNSGIRGWFKNRTHSVSDYGFTRFAAWD